MKQVPLDEEFVKLLRSNLGISIKLLRGALREIELRPEFFKKCKLRKQKKGMGSRMIPFRRTWNFESCGRKDLNETSVA